MNTHPAFNQISTFLKSKSVLSQLILINIAVFIVVNIINLFHYLFQEKSSVFIELLAVPSNLHSLSLKPWTLFTYMFLHENIFHIFFNMLMLYVGGRIFMEYLSKYKLISTYIFGGLVGGLFYIISFNIFPVFKDVVSVSHAIGASASVLAILVAIATYVPNYTLNLLLIGRIKLKHIAIVLVILDILSIDKGNPGGHIAHLGGALWGFIYIYGLRNGHDASMIIEYFMKLFHSLKKSKPKLKVERNEKGRPLTDEEYNKKRAEKQEKIDKILDKIAKSGYESLTKEEKELLFKMSDDK